MGFFSFQRTQITAITANQESSDETRLFKSVSIPGSLLLGVDGSGTSVTYLRLVGIMVAPGSCMPKYSQLPRQHQGQDMSAPGCQANLVKVEATHPEGVDTCKLFSTNGMGTEG